MTVVTVLIMLAIVILYSSILFSTLLYSTLLYSTLLYSTLLYSTLLYSTLLYSTLRFYVSTLPHSTPLQGRAMHHLFSRRLQPSKRRLDEQPDAAHGVRRCGGARRASGEAAR